MSREDAHLIANSPTWLQLAIEKIAEQQSEIERIRASQYPTEERQNVINLLLNSKDIEIEIECIDAERQYGSGEGEINVLPAYNIITITTTYSISGITGEDNK